MGYHGNWEFYGSLLFLCDRNEGNISFYIVMFLDVQMENLCSNIELCWRFDKYYSIPSFKQ